MAGFCFPPFSFVFLAHKTQSQLWERFNPSILTMVQTRSKIDKKKRMRKELIRYEKQDQEQRENKRKKQKVYRDLKKTGKKKAEDLITKLKKINTKLVDDNEELKNENKALQNEINLLRTEVKYQGNATNTTFNKQLYDVILTSSKRLKNSTGMDQQYFEDLLTRCRDVFHQKTNIGNKRKRAQRHKQHASERYQLLLTLMWLRLYPSLILMEILFNIHERTIIAMTKRTINVLHKVLQTEIKFPDDNEMKEHAQKFQSFQTLDFKKVVCSVDGTEITVARPSDSELERNHHSVKKKQHCFWMVNNAYIPPSILSNFSIEQAYSLLPLPFCLILC